MKKLHQSIGEFFSSSKQYTLTSMIIIFFLIFFIQSSVISLHRVISSSMEDTLLIGDVILVVKTWYGFRVPFSREPLLEGRPVRTNDIVLFEYPFDPKQEFVKRCVAVGGDSLFIERKTLRVNGLEVPLPKNAKFADPDTIPAGQSKRDYFAPMKVPVNSIYVLGDNRDLSYDSRLWGSVPEHYLIGKAVMVLWSTDPNAPWTDLNRKFRMSRRFTAIR